MYVLDTNVISELRRRAKAHAGVRAWSESIPVAQTYLSSITVFEVELGTLRLERKDKGQARILRDWIDNHILRHFADRILAIDAAVAQCSARLHVPRMRSERDALIAATAIVHGMTVVTRNEADFAFDGVKVLNPWN